MLGPYWNSCCSLTPMYSLGGGIWEGVLGSLPSEWSNLLFLCASWLSIKALEQHLTDRYSFEAELKNDSEPSLSSPHLEQLSQWDKLLILYLCYPLGRAWLGRKSRCRAHLVCSHPPKARDLHLGAHCLEKVHCVLNFVSRFFSDSNYCYNRREKSIYQPIV